MADRQTSTPRRSDNSGEYRSPTRSSSGERRASTSARSGGAERRQTSPRRNDVIRCENCGEDYSITYKRCPFCDERPGRGGIAGKRVANTRGGGYGRPVNPIQVVGLVVSLVLIISALFIVFRFIGAPLFSGGKSHGSNVSSSQGSGSTPDPTGSNTSAQAVQSITLNTSEINLDKDDSFQILATLSPAEATGNVIWSSSNTSAATVNTSGLVTNVNTGTSDVKVTITATCGDVTAEVSVTCKAGGSGTVANGTQGKIINAEKGLNIRSGPGTTYDKVASVANGAQVIIVGEENGWYKIIYTTDKTGYVSKEYVSVG